ncbi:hypothetical protein GOP47_0000344 [Adiantum capillus-veneris]|uniref:ARC6 IMS domain-containing protein n=1 Tax=Adiantum capillus-veneris TaxID=13818 RepID=A0A9D4ZSZ9_ADICA|nr:hypothetical protein GOP47_0000344 [Adiantum capillus-veneris]
MSSFTNARCWRVSKPPSLCGYARARSPRGGHITRILLTPFSASRRRFVCKLSSARGLYGNKILRQQRKPDKSTALVSSLPAVTERTITLPIDFYQVLGADTHFLADAVVRAYEARVNNLPAEGFSQDAIAARQEILRGACETLADPDLRGEYNESLLEDEAGTIMVDVPFSKVPGALCLLQEAGEMEIVLQVGQSLLKERLIRSYQRDVILAMALAYVELSREAMAETPPEIMRSCELLEKSLKLLQEEGGSSLALSLQEQIDHTIQHLNPRCLLELLSLPLEREHEGRRQEGKLGIQAILWTVGDGGAFLPIPGFTREAYLKEAFSHLTAAEQVAFFTATPSNIPAESAEVYAVALAHIAEGFVSKKPLMIQEADTLFLELQQANSSPSDLSVDYRPADQKLEFTFERGMCALLLGEIDDCRAWLGLDDTNSPYRDQSVADFVAANSSKGEEIDYLPGLCKLLESWLGVAVFPSFRELRESQVHLRAYFDDPNVLSYLEKLEKGGSPLAAAAAIAQLGAGAGAALDSVKASALETLQKVFSIKKGKGGSLMGNAAYNTLSEPASSEQMLTKGLENEVQRDTAPERGSSASSFGGTRPSGVAWSEGDEPQGAEIQKFSPLKIVGASVLMGMLVLGGWRALNTGKGLLKRQTNHSEGLIMNSPGSALAQKDVPQIDARIAEKIVRRWQAVKSQALGRDHAVKSLSEVLDGQMLENMNGRAQDAQKNGWYWEYKLTNLNVDSVTISTDGRRSTVEATLWEGANLYDEKTSQVLDSYQSSYTIRYELATINGRWKITSGIVLKS